MPSASSAKSAKASSVPPADPNPKSVVTTVKSAVVAVQLTNPLNSIELKTSSGAANLTGGGPVASVAVVAVAPNSVAAANVAAENHSPSAVSTPIKQMLVIVEHKIRNLEKRKTKLESYRAIQASGKELNADQKQAVAKYEEVMQCLEFARDLTKQMNQLSANAEKEQKKQARREAIVRAQAETVKIREVLTIQNILAQFEDSETRNDFLAGENGAVKLEESDLNLLEKFHFDATVKRQESPEDTPFLVSAQKAAELLSFTIDGRPKPYGDSTYENVRKIFQSIQECGYFDRAGKVDAADEEVPVETEQSEQSADEDKTVDIQTGEQENAMEMVSNEMVQMHIVQPQHQSIGVHVEVSKFEAPSAAAVPAPAFPQPAPMMQQPQQLPVPPPNMMGAGQIAPPQPQLQRPVMVPSVVPPTAVTPGGVVGQQPPQVAQMPPTGVPPPGATNQMHGAHFPPTTVRAVEQGYYKQHQYIQQMRPLAEVIGSTNFYFLQESELDSPEMGPPAGYTPNDGQAVNPVMNPAGVLAPQQSPSTVPQSLIQQQPPLQQTQIGLAQQQPGLQQKSQPNAASAIPSQTFTNQSFPPIVPPQAANMYPPNATQNPDMTGVQQQPQMPPVVYSSQQPPVGPGGIPLQSLVPTSQVVVSQQQSQLLNSMVDSQSVADVISQQAAANIANLMSGPPAGANVPIPGFPPNKFQQQPNVNLVGHLPTSATQLPDQLQQQSQQQVNDKNQMDDLNDNRGPKIDSSQDWDAHEPHVQQKPHAQAMASRQDEESNQWSNEVANNTGNGNKHDWNSNYDNQNDSNTWKNIPNDNYGGRGAGGRNNYPSNNRTSGGGSGRGGSGMRGNNPGGGGGGGNGGPPSNGYRGRPNSNYQQQQNNRNTGMYFRNNESYYQNQNGNSGGYGNKDTSGGNYVGGGGGGGPNNNYRPRGGPMPPNGRQQSGGRLGGGGPPNNGGPQQSQSGRNSAGGPGGPNPNRSSNVGGGNMSSNPNTRPGRNNPGSAYGNSRPPPNNVRQQQDINA